MAELRADGSIRGVGTLKRRGLLVGAAALAGAGLAKLGGDDRAEAAHDGSDEGFIHANAVNTTAATTTIVAAPAGSPVLSVRRSTTGVFPNADDAIQGLTVGGAAAVGVRGIAEAATGLNAGVAGENYSSTTNASGVRGLVGSGATNGVWGENTSTSNSATGVYGLASAAIGATVGVWGRSTSATAGATGTRGEATAPSGATIGVLGQVSSPAGIAVRGTGGSGIGVFGGSGTNIGVYADSVSNTAVFATSTRTAVWGRSAGGTGVFGQATQPNGYGVYGAAVSPGWAGYFEGNVYVTGQVFTSAAGVLSAGQAADGSTRALYSLDTAEPLVEDVGEGKLGGGRADVKLDPDFAAVADGGAYHVFLTPRGDSKGLYVSAQTPAGFEVREQQAGTTSLPFSYRVVAKRKGAVGKRLEKVERPKGLSSKELELPKLPEAPLAPEKPAAEPERPAPRPVGRPVPGDPDGR